MKQLTIIFYITLTFFSSYTCAATPDNRADAIRKNAQTAIHHQISVYTDSHPYYLVQDNKMVVIPAGRVLKMPADEARNIIKSIVNYNSIKEATYIRESGNVFIME
ncbi:hypothetical protein DP590_17715 [Salmonella enterica]|nr:hypothetical protein [Salmonella enterica]ECE0740239.1 hypothetical protein [Salmonella enterica subsp. enterica serovar Hvittingfoss]HEC8062334.1 hypothetical protein [Salmonella enterica subsp. enterica serovar Potsdam]EGA8118211.1 hypothetical protein [Salmonella enterica]EHO8673490.1 hypothetical protein [Salmonella enterica]